MDRRVARMLVTVSATRKVKGVAAFPVGCSWTTKQTSGGGRARAAAQLTGLAGPTAAGERLQNELLLLVLVPHTPCRVVAWAGRCICSALLFVLELTTGWCAACTTPVRPRNAASTAAIA